MILWSLWTLNSEISSELPALRTLRKNVKISTIKFVDANSYKKLLLKVTNDSPDTIWYSGYSKEIPVYSLECLLDEDWSEVQLGWCGTGVKRYKIDTSTSVTFDLDITHSFENKIFRVGFIFCSKERVIGTLWSDPLEYAKAGIIKVSSNSEVELDNMLTPRQS